MDDTLTMVEELSRQIVNIVQDYVDSVNIVNKNVNSVNCVDVLPILNFWADEALRNLTSILKANGEYIFFYLYIAQSTLTAKTFRCIRCCCEAEN